VALRRADPDALAWGDGVRVVSALRRLGHVELVDARIELPVRGGTLLATAISGEVRQTVAGHALALAGRIGDGDVAVTGTIAADGGLALTIGGRGLDASTLPLLAGRVTGRAMVRLDVRGAAAHPRIEGRLALHDGRLVGVRPLWTMPLTDEVRGLLGTVRPSLAGDDFPFDELRASYEWRDGRWRLPHVYVQEDGFLAGGRARVDRDGGLRGKGTVRVPEDVVAAAEPLVPALGEARDPAGTATVPFELSGRVSAPRLDLDRR
jgi:autotransporter translocation and assembly factor TamB